MPCRRVSLVGLLFLLAGAVRAGEYNQVLSVGDVAPAWRDLPGVDGRPHSLAGLPADKFVVLVFTCNSCPVARDYEDRIMDLGRRYAGELTVVAVNVNTIPEDRFDKMQSRAAERKFNFPYLYDESQQLAKAYGATGTPEFFVLSRVHPATAPTGLAGERTLLYMGSLDDNSDPAKVTRRYVEDAIAADKAGKKPGTVETFANGCRIRFARTRRP